MREVRIGLEAKGLRVSFWSPKRGPVWSEHEGVSPASWNRLLYALARRGVLLKPYCYRFTKEADAPNKKWYLDAWEEGSHA